jgi:NAD(P)H-hydrate epimerase
MKLVTAEEMRKIDRVTINDLGVPSLVLMERAGKAVADRIEDMFEKKKVVVVAGGGNNGGDGLVIARILKNRGWDVKVLVFSEKGKLSPEGSSQYGIADKMGIDIQFRKKMSALDLRDSVVVDALLGTGLNKSVRGSIRSAIMSINRSRSPVVSVDIPSGISSDTGQILGHAVRSDLTITFGLPKIGHQLYPGKGHTGNLFVEDIGFPPSLTSSENLKRNLTDLDLVRNIIKKRDPNTHKGSYGHVFIIAGSEGKTGAALLASNACLRAGAGAVTLGVPESLFSIFQSSVIEEMTYSLPSGDGGTVSERSSGNALDFINKHAGTVLLGPGLGVNKDVKEFVHEIVRDSKKPMVLDADGLNCMSGQTELFKKAKAEIIVTPHPNEMKRLLSDRKKNITAKKINERRIEIAEEFASMNNVVCVLKGAPTVIASPDGEVYVNTTGNPGMATAGSGDVLSGIIASFVAQGFGMFRSAVCGSYIHGLAGDLARDEIGEYSLIAGDITEYLPDAFKRILNIN